MNDNHRLGLVGITLVCCLCIIGVVVLAATGHDAGPAITMLAGLGITTGGGLAGYLIRVMQNHRNDAAGTADAADGRKPKKSAS